MAGDRLAELERRLAELGAPPAELVERFTRAGGPGGQHVNRTSTAVQLVHVPSGISVRAEGERSQRANRVAAREQLIAQLEARRAAEQAARVAARERVRRQRRRPSPAARQRNVERKRQRGAVKRGRGPVGDGD